MLLLCGCHSLLILSQALRTQRNLALTGSDTRIVHCACERTHTCTHIHTHTCEHVLSTQK